MNIDVTDLSWNTPPATVGRYRVVGCLGKGSMGIVYQARDARMDRDVAVKVLVADIESEPEARVVEQAPMRREQSQQAAALAEREIAVITERQPKASGFSSKIVETTNRQMIVIECTRAGLAGAESVRQYSIPSDQELFRLSCSAPAADFATLDGASARIAGSYQPVRGGHLSAS